MKKHFVKEEEEGDFFLDLEGHDSNIAGVNNSYDPQNILNAPKINPISSVEPTPLNLLSKDRNSLHKLSPKHYLLASAQPSCQSCNASEDESYQKKEKRNKLFQIRDIMKKFVKNLSKYVHSFKDYESLYKENQFIFRKLSEDETKKKRKSIRGFRNSVTPQYSSCFDLCRLNGFVRKDPFILSFLERNRVKRDSNVHCCRFKHLNDIF